MACAPAVVELLTAREGRLGLAHHLPRAALDELVGHTASERDGLGDALFARAALEKDVAARAEELLSVDVADEALQREALAAIEEPRVARDGHPAAPLEPLEEGPLRLRHDARRTMLEGREERPELGSVRGAFEAERALPHRRQAVLRRQHLMLQVREIAEPLEPRGGQHDGGEAPFFEALEPRLDVAAERAEGQVAALSLELRRAPERRGADLRPSLEAHQVAPVPRHEHVVGVFPLGEAEQIHAGRELLVAGHVLERVHRDVRVPAHDDLLDGGHEEPLAAHGVERLVEHLVALGDHVDLLDLEAGMERLELRPDPARLGEREVALARGDTEPLHAAPLPQAGTGPPRTPAFLRR